MSKRPVPQLLSCALVFMGACFASEASAWEPVQLGATSLSSFDSLKQSSYYEIIIGSRYADKENYRHALPYWQRAVEKNPSSVISQFNYAYALLTVAEQAQDKSHKQKLMEKAEWAFQRVRDLNPDLAVTYYKLGKIALQREDYLTACHYYEDGVRNHPENVALLFNLAAAYEKLDKLDKAEENYLKAITANPRFVYAHNNLGLLYEQTNRLEKAEAIYKEALSQVPDYNFARLNLGTLLQGQGRLDEAAVLYREALRFEPDNAWAHLYLGNTYFRTGHYSEALVSYKAAQKLNPSYSTIYYLISLTLHKLDRNDEALSAGLHYINLAPNGTFSQEANEMVMTLQQAKERATVHPEP